MTCTTTAVFLSQSERFAKCLKPYVYQARKDCEFKRFVCRVASDGQGDPKPSEASGRSEMLPLSSDRGSAGLSPLFSGAVRHTAREAGLRQAPQNGLISIDCLSLYRPSVFSVSVRVRLWVWHIVVGCGMFDFGSVRYRFRFPWFSGPTGAGSSAQSADWPHGRSLEDAATSNPDPDTRRPRIPLEARLLCAARIRDAETSRISLCSSSHFCLQFP